MSDRSNRIFLAVLGIVFVGLAATALAARWTWLSVKSPAEMFISASSSATSQPNAWGVGAFALALLLFGLGLGLLRRQLIFGRLPKAGSLTHTSEHGRVSLMPAALEKAVRIRTESINGVHGAKVRAIKAGRTPKFLARVEVASNADLGHVAGELDKVSRLVTEDLQVDSVTLDVHLRVDDDPPSRVV
jgi:uncharacterized alkaline shock family protein YloU